MNPTTTTPREKQLMLPPPTPSSSRHSTSSALVLAQRVPPSPSSFRQPEAKAERKSPPPQVKAERASSVTPNRARENSQLPTPPSSRHRAKSIVTASRRRSSFTPTAKFNEDIAKIRTASRKFGSASASASASRSRQRDRSATLDDTNNPFIAFSGPNSGAGSSSDEPIDVDDARPVTGNNLALQPFVSAPNQDRSAREDSTMSFASMDSFAPYTRRETTFDTSDRRASRPRPRGERGEGRADRAELVMRDTVLPPMPTALAEAIINVDRILSSLTIKEPEVVEVDVPNLLAKDKAKILKLLLSAFFGEEGEDARNEFVSRVHAEMALESDPPSKNVISRCISLVRNRTFSVIQSHINNYPSSANTIRKNNNLSFRTAEWYKLFQDSIKMETIELREIVAKSQVEQILMEVQILWCSHALAGIVDSLGESLQDVNRSRVKQYSLVLIDLAKKIVDIGW